MELTSILTGLAGVVLGALATTWVLTARHRDAGTRLRTLEAERKNLDTKLQQAEVRVAKAEQMLEGERQLTEEKLVLLRDAQHRFESIFQSLASKSLQVNNEEFLKLAKERFEQLRLEAEAQLGLRQAAVENLVTPIQETLSNVQSRLEDFDRRRGESHAALTQQLSGMLDAQKSLEAETSHLVQALRSPTVKGRWGEVTLRRVVELAGMSEHVDFDEQMSVDTDDGRLRPDMVIHLPGKKMLIVDAKAPLSAYLDALGAEDEAGRTRHLKRHAAAVRTHIDGLASKEYHAQFAEAPDFAILFLPGEPFLSAACQYDGELLDYAFQQNVILASPATLLSLLKAAFYGWQQERVAANAEQIHQLGLEMYDRVLTLADHFRGMGTSLRRAVEHYNGAMGSLEGRVLVTGRRLRQLGVAATEELEPVEQVDVVPRIPLAEEFVVVADDAETDPSQPSSDPCLIEAAIGARVA